MAQILRVGFLLIKEILGAAAPPPGVPDGQLDFSDPDQSGWIVNGF
jgi:hypothetical protein